MPPALLRHAVLSLALLSPALAAAQKPPPADRQGAARTLAQEGLKLYGADRWAEALAAFREADGLYHAPSVTLYIARTQRKLGKLLDARATYDQLLAEDLPKDASPQFVQAHVEAGRELEGLKHQVPTLRVVVAGVPAGEAAVLLDGTPLLDGTRELDPGKHTVQVQRRAGQVVTRVVTLAEGSHETVTVDLAFPTSVPPSRGWILPGGIALGVGVLGLGAGAMTGAMSLAKVSDLKTRCPTKACSPSLKGEGDSAVLLGNVSTAGFVVGGVGAAAGAALLFLLRPSARPPQGEAGWRASVGIGGVEVEGRF
jgi:hypothetical protein